MHPRLTAVLLAAASVLPPLSARAACTLDAQPVNFGVVEVTRVSFSTGRIDIVCDETVAVSVALAGNGGQRAMVGPSGARLVYELFTDATYRRVWGDGQGRGVPVQTTVAAGERRRLTVYGVVPAQPGVPPGQYSSQLVINITF